MEKYNDKDQTINVAETGAAKKITDGIIKARSNAMKKKTEAIRLINSSDENREIKIKCLQLQAKISLRIAATSFRLMHFGQKLNFVANSDSKLRKRIRQARESDKE